MTKFIIIVTEEDILNHNLTLKCCDGHHAGRYFHLFSKRKIIFSFYFFFQPTYFVTNWFHRFTHLQCNLETLRLRGPMQRMHEVGALFFLYAFPFPSIFRTPLSQKRRTQNTRILFKVVRYSVSLQINKGALKALAPKSLKPAGTPCTALYCPKSPDVDI